MSDIASKIAAEHRWLATHCSCGHPIDQVKLGLADQVDHYIRHVAEVNEAAVRARIAADIRATFMDPERMRPRDPEGEFATDLLNDWQWAARIAEGGTS